MPQWNYGQNSVEFSFNSYGNETRYGSMLFAFVKRWTINLLRAEGGWVILKKIFCNDRLYKRKSLSRDQCWKKNGHVQPLIIMQNVTQEKNYNASIYPEKKKKLPVRCSKKSQVYRPYQSSDRPLPPKKLSNGRPPRLCWPRLLLGFVAVLVDFCILFWFSYLIKFDSVIIMASPLC